MQRMDFLYLPQLSKLIISRKKTFASFRLTEDDLREIHDLAKDERIGERVNYFLINCSLEKKEVFTSYINIDYSKYCTFHLWP
jgi:chaperonin cofactor prefoldin